MFERNLSTRAAVAIILSFILVSIIGPHTLNHEDVENWDNLSYWRLNPQGVPPEWYGELVGLPKTEWLQGERQAGAFVFTYDFHYSSSPSDIIFIPNSTGVMRIKIIGPDGREYILWDGYVFGEIHFSKNPSVFVRIAGEKCNVTPDGGNLLFHDAFNVIFSKPTEDCLDHPEFLKGEYKIVVEGAEKEPRIRVLGKSYGLLGTDTVGRDVWTGFIWGMRETIVIAILGSLATVGLALVLGTLSVLSSWVGKIADFVSRLVTVTPVLPVAVSAVVLVAAIDENYVIKASPLAIALIVGILMMGNVSRNVRSMVEEELRKEYVESARALGGSSLWILRKHVSKVLVPYTVYQFALAVPGTIAFITLLGFFNIVPGFNWGTIMSQTIREGATYRLAWWQVVPVGVSIGLLALSFVSLSRRIEEEFLKR
ncbi:ABC-type transport system, permease component [Thermococcus sp. 4557]|uniref:ABC transporter permease n=1 Tax=Thermococcus sp. (strain CGMCC 1.5172 / 4557) TaxID=1042877 RepID=UPI000219E872|nr:ABC transporter permease subunit [Thermococcus sp. 4557]AEK73190.1 ABC-type transport system, permease component [Thermococcus sp. 4557]